MNINGKTAVITGAGSGIGEAVARVMAGKGVKVFLGDLNEETAAQVADDIRKNGGTAAYRRLDVTSEKDVEAFMAAAAAESGEINLCSTMCRNHTGRADS